MITRETLKLFGCHADAVERFAKEAGLQVEAESATFKLGQRVQALKEGNFVNRRTAASLRAVVVGIDETRGPKNVLYTLAFDYWTDEPEIAPRVMAKFVTKLVWPVR